MVDNYHPTQHMDLVLATSLRVLKKTSRQVKTGLEVVVEVDKGLAKLYNPQ